MKLQAKPSKHVWVGGCGSSVAREKLEEVLSKFGKIEEFKFFRDRNSALVDFARLEDASAAVKNLNGFQIGDDCIRVDFLRSYPAKRVSNYLQGFKEAFRIDIAFQNWELDIEHRAISFCHCLNHGR